ncbi:hypothetical protein G5714_000685 [Onychostoma macrolepis]|uniref:Uncharacterized protein n=1 Tax=Onychostoma macrolepis TaxID=369639 RepID=A0A7J6DIK4_9TELE|nr:hypothetical protein G5714_000685 [Onychostoma macrolepis]
MINGFWSMRRWIIVRLSIDTAEQCDEDPVLMSISKQPAVDVEQPNFVSGLAVLFVLLYDFNLQYQEEVACTPAIEVRH